MLLLIGAVATLVAVNTLLSVWGGVTDAVA
jgi:hypothetical protein